MQELGATFDIGPIPEDLQAKAEEWHEKLVDTAIEVDDEAMEAYLEGQARPLPLAQTSCPLRCDLLASALSEALDF